METPEKTNYNNTDNKTTFNISGKNSQTSINEINVCFINNLKKKPISLELL